MRRLDPATDALLLGAGFSYEAGMPLADELTELVRKNLNPKVIGRLAALHDRNETSRPLDPADRAAFMAVLSDTSLNYERMVDLLVKRWRPGPRVRDGDVYARWIYFAAHELLSQLTLNTKFALVLAAPLYVPLKIILDDRARLDVFSLNHDLVLEMLCDLFSIDLDCGLAQGETRFYDRERNHHVVMDMAERVDGRISLQYGRQTPGINLLKLHGSLDQFGWGDHGNKTTRRIVKLRRRADLDVIDHYRMLIERVNYTFHPGDLPLLTTNERIVHGEDGEMEFLRNSSLTGTDKFSPSYPGYPLSEALDAMRNRLAAKDHLYVIGSSLADEHMKEIIRDWGNTGDRTLHIVGPHAKRDAIPPFSFSGSIESIPMTATQFMAEAAGIPYDTDVQRHHDLINRLRGKARHMQMAPVEDLQGPGALSLDT